MTYPDRIKTILLLSMVLLLGGGLEACDRGNRAADQIAEDSASAQSASSRLSFDNITLEQADEAGKIVWKIKAARADYSPDEKTAKVTTPTGELFQDGEAVYEVEAETGEVHQNGEVVFLRGDVTATDTRDGAVITGEELEWRPKEGLLLVRGGVKGIHPQLNASAQEAKVLTRDRRMELIGEVAATTKDPNLRLQAEQLVWFIADKRVESSKPVKIERYVDQQIVDTATGNQAEVNLVTKIVNLKQNANLNLLEPPLQVTSESLLWNVQDDTVIANQPVQIFHKTEQVNITAGQGRVNLEQQVANLSQNVQVVGQRNNAQLNADQMAWTIPTQTVDAQGNVTYRQTDPPFNLTGDRAVGKLENQTIVVSGGRSGDRVVTEIIPE